MGGRTEAARISLEGLARFLLRAESAVDLATTATTVRLKDLLAIRQTLMAASVARAVKVLADAGGVL